MVSTMYSPPKRTRTRLGESSMCGRAYGNEYKDMAVRCGLSVRCGDGRSGEVVFMGMLGGGRADSG